MSSKRDRQEVEEKRRRRTGTVKQDLPSKPKSPKGSRAAGTKGKPPGKDTRTRRMPLQNPDFEAEIDAWQNVSARDDDLGERAMRHGRALALVAEGWRADSDVVAEEKAHLAMRENDLCSDAWLLAARRVETRPEQRLRVYETALRCAEALLGPDFEKRYRGRFWQLAEARPFLRARSALGLYQWDVGFRNQARSHLEEILKLEPRDPLGMRFHLLGWNLTEGRHREARGLLRRYPKERAAVFRWGAVLERLQAGDEEGARRLYERALTRDAHSAEMIASPTPPPSQLPTWRAPGSREDALLCAQVLRPAWRSTPKALAWLRAAIAPEPEGEAELRQTA